MASNNLQEKAVFTFIWAIENSSVLSIYGARSPAFTVDSLAETRWELSISTFSDIIACYIFRKPAMNGPDSIDVDFELSFLNSAGLPLVRKRDNKQFKKGDNFHFIDFARMEDVFKRERNEYTPKDILTVRCQIWGKADEMSKADLCFARTHMGMDRRYFIWPIKEFGSLQEGDKRTHIVKSVTKGLKRVKLILFLCQSGQDGENIHITIDTGRSAAECWIDCRISLLDIEGKVVHNRRKGWLSSSEDRFSEFQQFYLKNDLLEDKVTLLPNDTLNLRCEFTVYTKSVWSQIEGQKKKKAVWTRRERNASQ
ncbi:TD and POZ domain-containing protein 4 [Caerostris darwini]|uniref:TD and POZ domain-containing protein 4 n=1 Tax=Caerostris darwini TaxID=1538125 RepID=A0AAV4P1N0_9ARAC|nr:TD and POZ domain-containing protein 4 [Caerostris darwini]